MNKICKKITAITVVTCMLIQNIPMNVLAEGIQTVPISDVSKENKETSKIDLEELFHDKTIFLGDIFDPLEDILPNELENRKDIEVVKNEKEEIQQVIFNKGATDEFIVKIHSGSIDTKKIGSYKISYEVRYNNKSENIERTINVIDVQERLNFYRVNKDEKDSQIDKNISLIQTDESKDKVGYDRELLFTLAFDKSKNKLIVSNQNLTPMSNSTNATATTIYTIKVVDKDNNEKANVELKTTDSSISESLKELEKIEFNIGDSIEVRSFDNSNIFEMIDASKVFDVNKISEGVEIFTLSSSNDDTKTDLDNDDEKDILQLNNIATITDTNQSNQVDQNNSTPTSIADNTITIKGIKFADTENPRLYLDTRFKIQFDPENKKINIVEQDGKIFSNVNNKYFEMVLYDKNGNIKQEVVLNGRDRSTDEKLDVFKNLSYEEGDFLYIWHQESDTNFNIAGNVDLTSGASIEQETSSPDTSRTTSISTQNFNNGVPKKYIEDRTKFRFRIDSDGLQLVENEKPVITNLTDLITKRTEKIDLTTGLTITDDIDKTIERTKVVIDEKSYNLYISGDYNVGFTVRDSWGLSSDEVTRKLKVDNSSDIDGIFIEVGSQSNPSENAFRIGFDDIEKKLIFIENENVDINPGDTDDNFILSVYNKYGSLKKKFRFKGEESLNTETKKAISNYSFADGDYISVWSKYPQNLKIKGNISNIDNLERYDDGIQDNDHMDNVRFQLSNLKFTAVYNQAPVINGARDITILRGQDPDLLNGITVTDDHDKDTLTNSVKTNYKSGDNLVKGTKEIVYSVKDSWGRESTTTRTLTVNAAHGIENNGIELKVGDKTMLKMSFDSLTNDILYTYDDKVYREGNASDLAFNLAIYNDNWEKIVDFPINNEQTITKEMIDKISARKMVYGMKVGVFAADRDKVSIFGDMVNSQNNYLNGFKNDDIMHNTFFEFTEAGLKPIYNKKPQITGVDSIEVLLNSTFDPMHNVQASDDIGIEGNITTSGTIDTSIIGPQEITYTVTDKLGRSTSVIRTIHVVPNYRENSIVLENSNGETAFKIGFDKLGTNFEISSQSTNQINSSLANEKVFEISIYDLNNKNIANVELNGGDLGNTDKLNVLKTIPLRDGYTIKLWSKDSTKLKIEGNIEKDSQILESSYSDGINDPDYMNNVRFEIKNSKLKAVYNDAPQISFNEELEFYIGERTDFLDGVEFTDDKGNPSKDNAKVYYGNITLNNEVDRDDFTTPGTHELTYEITDNWGRKATTTRTVTAKPGMERHTISFGAVGSEIASTDPSSTGYEEFTGLSLGINTSDMTLRIKERSNERFLIGVDNREMYSIDVVNSSGVSILPNGKITIVSRDHGSDSKFNALDNLHVKYGDKIKITTTQGRRLKISGQMYNTGNDYTNGIVRGYDIFNTEFEITPRGLVENFEEHFTYDEDKVYIEIYTNFTGDLLTRFEIDTTRRTITALDGNTEENIDFRSSYRYSELLRMIYKNSNGQILSGKTFAFKGFTFRSTLGSSMNYNSFRAGDYITLELKSFADEYKNKIKIIGNIEKSEGLEEDFSDGISDPEFLNNVRFTFTSRGTLRAEYNTPPEIKGAEDIDIAVGDNSFTLTSGVTVVDDRDNNITVSTNVNSININQTTEYTVTYTARDSWGRITTKQRKINVRPKVFFNTIDVYQDTNLTTPAFTIGFDNKTNKYKATVNNEVQLSPSLETKEAFKMYIIGSNRQVKETISIIGNQFIDDSIFEKLNNIDYQEGDYIRVWRARSNEDEPTPINTTTPQQIQTLKINGDIQDKREDYSDGISTLDNMNNVAFKVRNEGFQSIYNDAPVFNGLENMEFFKSTTHTTAVLLNNVTVSDTFDTIDKSQIEIIDAPNFNRVGEYNVTFKVTDLWGRSTIKTVKVTIKSNILNNKIDVYGGNSNQDKLFSIGFTKDGKLNIEQHSQNQLGNGNTFSITIFNRFGEELKKVNLNSSDNVLNSELQSLNNFDYLNNYYIQLNHTSNTGVRINGNVVNTTHDYSNGFSSTSDFENTRFMITEEGLKETRKVTTANIEGLSKLTITRGDEVDLTSGVTVNHASETFTKDQIKIEGFDNLKAGTQTVTYSVTDSWGTKFSETRTIEVLPVNELEKNIIKVKNSSDGTAIFTVGFDSLENKLVATTTSTTSILDGSFSISIYDDTEGLVDSIEINNTNIQKELKKINQISIGNGYRVALTRTDHQHGLSIDGEIDGKREDYNNGVDDKDNIDNVRFEILDSGLKSIYNEAPEFKKITEITLELGEEFNPFIELEVTDDHDGKIANSNIQIDKDVDTTTLGKYVLNYTATDSWGRQATTERTVWVTSIVDKNSFDFYSKNSSNEKLFSIKLDSKLNQFIVTTTSSTTSLDSSKGLEKVLEIDVYRDDKSVLNIKLNGDDNASTDKLNQLNGFNYKYGDRIGIKIPDFTSSSTVNNDPYAKSMLKMTGEIFMDKNKIHEDYDNGIDNMDYLDNVRFEIKETGIEAIYNDAPVLTITTTGTLQKYKSDNIDDYDLLDIVKITDDHDDIPVERVVIDTDQLTDIKTYTLHYYVEDNWGRRSTTQTIDINLLPAIERNIIEFDRIRGTQNTDGIVSLIKSKAFEIRFDHDSKQIKLIKGDTGGLIWNGFQMYDIEVLDSNNDSIYKKCLTGYNSANDLDGINNLTFDYGYKIKLATYQGPVIRILGKVINPQEDYEDGTDFGYILANTTFEITKDGLKAYYQDQEADDNTTTNDSIAYFAGINGKLSFNMEVDISTKTFKFSRIDNDSDPYYYNEYIDTHDYNNTQRFTITHYSANGTKVREKQMNSRMTPSDLYNVFNGKSFEIGDYLTFKVSDTRNKNLNFRLYGSIDGAKYDYSQGITKDHLTEFNTARFYITENGLEARYNQPPKIIAPDIVIQLGTNFNTTQGLIVEDDYDQTVSDVRILGGVTPNKPGAYMITYIATDSWGGQTIFDRFVIVQAPPEIKLVGNTSIELNSMQKSEVDDYLRNRLVEVTDFEDGDLNDITEIENTFNPNEVGTYDINYRIEDTDNNVVTTTVTIDVIKSIKVSVPPNKLPFQIVTNLKDKSQDPFVSGTINLSNNNIYSEVYVNVKSFTQKQDSGSLNIVDPNSVSNWEQLDSDETMSKMALGIYAKQGFTGNNTNKDNPTWLVPNMQPSGVIGVLDKATAENTPTSGKLSFISKHGENFKGGTSRGKFDLILEFK